MVVPTTYVVDHTHPQHVFQCLNTALFLHIFMRMESSTDLYLCANDLLITCRFPQSSSSAAFHRHKKPPKNNFKI